MKSSKPQFWLFGMDAILEFGQKGVLEVIEISKQIRSTIIQKFENQKASRKLREKSIQIGKRQDQQLETEYLRSNKITTKNSNTRLKEMTRALNTKDIELEHEP